MTLSISTTNTGDTHQSTTRTPQTITTTSNITTTKRTTATVTTYTTSAPHPCSPPLPPSTPTSITTTNIISPSLTPSTLPLSVGASVRWCCERHVTTILHCKAHNFCSAESQGKTIFLLRNQCHYFLLSLSPSFSFSCFVFQCHKERLLLVESVLMSSTFMLSCEKMR